MPREPALLTSEGRMPRAQSASSERRHGCRSERPATGRGQPRTFTQEVARYPGECRPHSVFALPLQRPARSSSPAPIARVQGWQPMLT
jgi:hypothetical protein